jgi:homoserine kinase type II
VSAVEALALGSVNSNFRLVAADGQRFFARVYEEQALTGAETEVRLLSILSREGVPVVAPLEGTTGARVVDWQGKPFAVFPWVEGDWLCLERVTPERCHAMGAALAQVHLASPSVGTLPAGRFRPADMLKRLERVEREGEPHLRGPVERIRRLYDKYVPLRDEQLPLGVSHGDLFRDNVLWQGPKIAALLDFESAAWGNFAYDLMVTALAWCYRDALQTSNVQAMFQGYSSVRRLDPAERAALETEGALACLRFATTRLTDFEMRTPVGGTPGRDYRRFLERLAAIESGAFAPTWASLG